VKVIQKLFSALAVINILLLIGYYAYRIHLFLFVDPSSQPSWVGEPHTEYETECCFCPGVLAALLFVLFMTLAIMFHRYCFCPNCRNVWRRNIKNGQPNPLNRTEEDIPDGVHRYKQ
jgi:hypothetical protein